MTDWAQMFTGLLFYAYVEIHRLWRLVFDNNQYVRCLYKSKLGLCHSVIFKQILAMKAAALVNMNVNWMMGVDYDQFL